MQEQEYLRHTVARIAAMTPDLVLVQRNVSRLAQESLLRLGISLVLNVKPQVLERVARITGADIVKSVDAQVGRPRLGTCSNFYIKSFTSETGELSGGGHILILVVWSAKFFLSLIILIALKTNKKQGKINLFHFENQLTPWFCITCHEELACLQGQRRR